MQIETRISKLSEVSFSGALIWFSEMQTNDLLFHPEDDPADIIRISDGSPTFSTKEVTELRNEIATLEAFIGHEALIEAAYPVFMRSFGVHLGD